MSTLLETLETYYGYSSFRDGQETIIEKVLAQHDVLAILPTGAGKSLCYQLPTLHSNGKCLVISPLIALIKDQVENLHKRNIGAIAVHSGMSKIETEDAYKKMDEPGQHFIFVSPERLKNPLFLSYLSEWEITLIAVDEAHCISAWGYDFRPPYLEIPLIKQFAPKASVIALTASATQLVAKDICAKLALQSATIIRESVFRKNLKLHVINAENKLNALVQILQPLQSTSLIYCANRKTTAQISDLLLANNKQCLPYHAGMDINMRNKIQAAWIAEETKIVACTQAFGMGIDKSNVRCVVHYNFTESLEAYYQEIGRAGRDGQSSDIYLLYRPSELVDIEQKIATRYPEADVVFAIYNALCDYYRIAPDEGENIWYELDIATLAEATKIKTLLLHNTLQILQMQDFILLSDGAYLQSKIKVQINKADIDFLEKHHPVLHLVLISILRLYSGIHREHITVQEAKIAHLAELDVSAIKPALEQLHQHQMIDYIAAKDKPQIMLTQGRVRAYDYHPDLALVKFLRDRYRHNLSQVHAYINNDTTCRMVFIAKYFGEENILDCQVCDICKNKKQIAGLSAIDFNALQAQIRKAVRKAQLKSINDLTQLLTNYNPKDVHNVAIFMIENNSLQINNLGLLSVN